MNIYMMGVHRREVKLKELVRLRGLCTNFTKERVFEPQGMINDGEATRNYMEELMKDEHFSKVCLSKLRIDSPSLVIKEPPFPGFWEGSHLHKGRFIPCS